MIGAALGELVGVAHQIQQCLTQPHLIGVQRANRRVTMDPDSIAILCCHRLDRLDYILDNGHQWEGFELQLHTTGLDL